MPKLQLTKALTTWGKKVPSFLVHKMGIKCWLILYCIFWAILRRSEFYVQRFWNTLSVTPSEAV
jgi:hypothetical protein